MQILRSSLVLPHRYLRTHPLLPPGPSLPFVHLAIHQRPSLLRRSWCYASGFRDQLHFLGTLGLHLQLRDPSLPL